MITKRFARHWPAALLGAGLIALPGQALAFDFGFVRAPDWMDPYFVGLIIIQLPFWIALFIFKPRDVPFSKMYKTKMAAYPTFLLRMCQILYTALMVLLFTGMYLARA